MFGALIGGALGLVGSIFGGNAAGKAAKQAGQLQYQATQQAIGEQRRQFDLTRQDYQPYLETGTQALGQQGNLLGLNGADPQAAAIAGLQQSPLYQALLRSGQEQLLQTASATGGLRGGNFQRSMADFGADTLAQVIERQLAQYGALSGRGQQATGDLSQFGQASTGNIINLINRGAGAQAGAILTNGGIQNQMWNNIGGYLSGLAPQLGKLF